MVVKYHHDDLVKQLHTSGWRLTDEQPDNVFYGTLHDVLAEGHIRKLKGNKPGSVEEIETAIELDMLQIELLWREIGLPTI